MGKKISVIVKALSMSTTDHPYVRVDATPYEGFYCQDQGFPHVDIPSNVARGIVFQDFKPLYGWCRLMGVPLPIEYKFNTVWYSIKWCVSDE